ncbi:MAG: NUDIX domain-containing protein [Acidimicrobiia bacterium]|nr:NUDIX domain-containing protein [Acidimicrobiia bacterium]
MLTDLVALLEAHVPVDEKEAADLASILRVVERDGPASMSRHHFTPGHLTASAFVTNGEGVLLIHHDRLGRWLQPGGHVEPDDGDLRAAAIREVEEETTLRDLESLGLLDVDVHEIPAARGEPTHLHLDVRWAFRASGEPAPGDGVSAARWARLEELPLLGADRSVLRGAVKLLGGAPS